MSKRRKIIIALGVLTIGVLTIGVLTIGALGYVMFSRRAGDSELVFPATEVGTPVGDNVTKDIGPAGGTLVSPDGRLTLTVPANALTETVAFAIQPVTNKFEAGLGLAYRLEPEGKTFAIPLDISVHYDDHDLEGTFPEVLSIAYQDKDGAWHMQQAMELDKDKKTVTLPATHFSVYAFIYLYRLSPAKATVHVGESVKILATYCHPGHILFGILTLGKEGFCDHGAGQYQSAWKLQGEGKLTGADVYPAQLYTAPGKKPTPNVATVLFAETADVIIVAVERPCTASGDRGLRGKNNEREFIPKKCYERVEMVPELDTVRSVITIIDRGYTASGKQGDTVYSGVICSIDEKFTIKGKNRLWTDIIEFDPSKGTYSYSTKWETITMNGTGSYTIEGADTDKPRIVVQGSGYEDTPAGRVSQGTRTGQIDLVPLDKECKP